MNIIDNVLSDQVFSNLRDLILGSNMPWYYKEVTTYKDESNNKLYDGSFSHWALTQNGSTSEFYPVLYTSLLACLDRSGQKLDKLLRIRIGKYMLTPEEFIHTPHIDIDIPHVSGLLYLHDSDSGTHFYNEFYNPNCGVDSYTNLKQIKLTHCDTVYPKENRFVWFDGLQYHCSSSPTTQKRRVVVNFNYTVKE